MRLTRIFGLDRAGRSLALLPLLLATACGGAASSPAPSGAAGSPISSASAAAASKPGLAATGSFQADWDALVAAAKEDGKLSIGFSPNPPLEQQILPAFEHRLLHGRGDDCLSGQAVRAYQGPADHPGCQRPQQMGRRQGKGTIGSLDVTGLAGQAEAAIFLKLKGDDFVKQLYLGQQVKFASEQRILGDWIAKNQYAIGIALPVDEYVNMKSQGLPVARLKLTDLTAQTTAVLLPGVMDGAPHPNAAKLFMNWALTREGMQAFSDGIQEAMMRTDVDYSKLNPDDVPSATSNYFDDCTMDYNTGERTQLNERLKADLGH